MGRRFLGSLTPPPPVLLLHPVLRRGEEEEEVQKLGLAGARRGSREDEAAAEGAAVAQLSGALQGSAVELRGLAPRAPPPGDLGLGEGRGVAIGAEEELQILLVLLRRPLAGGAAVRGFLLVAAAPVLVVVGPVPVLQVVSHGEVIVLLVGLG